MSAVELGDSANPRKWRFTWEAQSLIPTLRLFIFDSSTKPSVECKNLKVHLDLWQSLVLVNWLGVDASGEVSLRVPIPRVLIDDECPVSFRCLDDHIEVKFALLLPVDHPIVSSFDSVLHLAEHEENGFLDASVPLLMESDHKSLSSMGGLHFYCRSCSTKLTKSPLRHFEEMPSVDWCDVADNWFGGCCCSFGGVSEKLVTSYANSYTYAKGTCLLSSTTVTVCMDDVLLSKYPAWDGRPSEYEPYISCENGLSEAAADPQSEYGRVASCNNSNEREHSFNAKVKFIPGENENRDINLKSEVTDNETITEKLFCLLQVSDFPKDVASAPICCAHSVGGVLNPVDGDCTHDVADTSDQKPAESVELLENQKSFLNGFLGNIFMARSFNLSADVEWKDFVCPQCSSLLGAYPCGNDCVPVDGRIRLFKCHISTCLPVGGSGDVFGKYTLERMFTNQLLESANDELSFRTVIRDLRTKSPLLQIVLLNPNSWCCTGYCFGAKDTIGQVSKLDLYPVVKVLFSDYRNSTESQLRMLEDSITKTVADEVFMLSRQIEELIESLTSTKDILPHSYAFLQGLPLSSIRR